ncbi:hypothetical protein Kpol_1023p60 [Vanderwaltozyma polyspora DSM 70294]|uniref:FAD dependent oxidoreductase domain-containing protein n=1 Tax=Vanderwaltozyma polyspora (strain ATCC 22028 / DSM 70294 / BCRC 21397 / CBS 2163 / NBRC 10782 / NRRL Y-8283 / UCD 57-17) TaxID=436907 RepID=A7TFT3_VANPO|nr:uncharacterized protein Kpol_1023p60 [Vanderwaltozyma polyspora DSM 70294]EDO18891.1 hypothetical protein Kpol_1023p60 [Vanderwaltozyma polyspora DSM 70294]
MALDFIEIDYKTVPSPNAAGKKHIVIVGGGIIGACTAFYLTRHPKFSGQDIKITLFETTEVAGGASGKAGGLLASWAFPEEIVPLSFQMHQDLSDEFNGEENWDYRRLPTVSLEADLRLQNANPNTNLNSVYGSDKTHFGLKNKNRSGKLKSLLKDDDSSSISSNSKVNAGSLLKSKINNDDNDYNDTKNNDSNDDDDDDDDEDCLELDVDPNGLPKDLTWIRRFMVKEWSSLGSVDSTAQVHPMKFTRFMLSKAIETGAVEVVLGKVSKINMDDNGVANSLQFIPTTPGYPSQDPIEINNVDKLILTMGPWTSKILLDCPISGLRAHSIVLKPRTEDDEKLLAKELTPFALFSELQINKNQTFSPEIYSRKDEIYVCGEGDTLMELPETLNDVTIVQEKCDELLYYASKILTPSIIESSSVLVRQACYLPVLNVSTSSGPLIGETNVKNLFIASGHSCWGINNAPVTGKVLSEIILDGEAKCVDISSLDPTAYFDASILD